CSMRNSPSSRESVGRAWGAPGAVGGWGAVTVTGRTSYTPFRAGVAGLDGTGLPLPLRDAGGATGIGTLSGRAEGGPVRRSVIGSSRSPPDSVSLVPFSA